MDTHESVATSKKTNTYVFDQALVLLNIPWNEKEHDGHKEIDG